MNNSIFAFSSTETGYNHIKNSKVCEDASDFYDDERMHICVVADGHGSDNYPRTDRGAKFAVDAAIHCIIDFAENADPEQVLDDEQQGFPLLMQLAKAILNEWYLAVETDYSRHPIVEEELFKVSDKYKRRYLSEKADERHPEKAYGCTLIAYAVTQDYSFGLQIGDGKCVVIDRYGKFSEPIPWDENCQLNVTTSICDADAIEEFRFSISSQTPTAVFCGSDGIDDSYANSEELYALYRSILKIHVEHGKEVGQKEIKEYLPVLTKKGSGDDVSIGVIIDMEHALEIAPLMEVQAQLFTKRAERDEKKHKLEMQKDKKESFRNKLHNLMRLDKHITDTAISIDQLTDEINLLNQDIAGLEQELSVLYKQEQELVYDSQVASFDASEKESIYSSEDMEGLQTVNSECCKEDAADKSALQSIAYEDSFTEDNSDSSGEPAFKEENVVSASIVKNVGTEIIEITQNVIRMSDDPTFEDNCENKVSIDRGYDESLKETADDNTCLEEVDTINDFGTLEEDVVKGQEEAEN